jgi:integrase/recombinase XerD
MKLSDGIAGYIAHKRATGLKYESAESHFKAFLTCTGDVPLGMVKTDVVATFLDHYSSATVSWRDKYHLLMYFLEFWSARGEIAPVLMPPPRPPIPRTFVPHIYSKEQVRSLLRAASGIPQRYKESTSPQTLRTLFLFLYGTGANVGEAVALKSSDIDMKRGTVTVRNNRYNLARMIPICKDLQVAMQRYERWRLRRHIRTDLFFVKNDSNPLIKSSLTANFRKICKMGSVCRVDGVTPTMQDFRPTFAVHRIQSWMRTGANMNKLLPALAVYMGHGGLSSTQKYLSLTPERFQEQLSRLSPIRRRGHWRNDKDLMAFLGTLSSASRAHQLSRSSR